MLTGIAVWLGGEARKGCGLPLALGPWGRGLEVASDTRRPVAGPRPMEHETQPHQGDQHQLIEKESGDHGNTPSYPC